MKKQQLVLLVASVLAPLFIVGTVAAVDGTEATTQTVQTTDTKATAPKALSTEEKAALSKRVEDRKAALKTRLTTAEQQRISTRCSNAQGVVTALTARTNSAQTKHVEAYSALIARLATLQGKYEDAGKKNAELQAAIDTLKLKTATYQTDAKAYIQATTDLAAIDCKADPNGFKASLEAARSALATVRKDMTDIRTYINDTVKPLLQTLRTAAATNGGTQ